MIFNWTHNIFGNCFKEKDKTILALKEGKDTISDGAIALRPEADKEDIEQIM